VRGKIAQDSYNLHDIAKLDPLTKYLAEQWWHAPDLVKVHLNVEAEALSASPSLEKQNLELGTRLFDLKPHTYTAMSALVAGTCSKYQPNVLSTK
jgi:hypothetical protein